MDQMFQSLKILPDSIFHKSKYVPKLVNSLDETWTHKDTSWEKKKTKNEKFKLNLRTKNDQELHRDSWTKLKKNSPLILSTWFENRV